MLGIGIIEIIVLVAAAWYFGGRFRRLAPRYPRHDQRATMGTPHYGSRNLKSGVLFGLAGALIIVFGLAATWTVVRSEPAQVATVVTQHYGSNDTWNPDAVSQVEVVNQQLPSIDSSQAEINALIHVAPRWSYGRIVMLIIGIGFVTMFVTRLRNAWCGPPHRKSQFIRGAVTAAVCLGLFSSVLLVTYRMRTAGPVSAASLQQAVQETIESSPFEARVIPQASVVMPYGVTPVWIMLPIGTFGLLGIFLLVWFVAAIRWKSRSATSASPTFDIAAEQGFGWGWLVIPTICFVGVLYQSLEVFYPAPQAYYPDRYDDFPQRYERMHKSIKDYTDLQLKTADAASQPQSWLIAAANKTPEADHIVLASGPYTTAKEAEDELLPAVQDLVEREFHKTHPWQGEWRVPLSLIRERVIDATVISREPKTIGKFSGDLFHAFMNVNLSPDVLQTFEPSWKASIVERRLLGMGLVLGWVVSQLLLCAAYFHSQGASPRPGRWRWKLAATIASVGLALVAGYWLEWIVKVM